MKASISQFDAENEYFFDESCFITELSNSADDPGVSIAWARFVAQKVTHEKFIGDELWLKNLKHLPTNMLSL